MDNVIIIMNINFYPSCEAPPLCHIVIIVVLYFTKLDEIDKYRKTITLVGQLEGRV